MGLLLMEFEYQRAKQDLNGDQLQGIRLNSKLKTYTKRLESITSIFAKKKTQVESQWSRLSNELSNNVSRSSVNGFSDLSLAIPGVAAANISNLIASAIANSKSTDGQNQKEAEQAQKADAKTQEQNQMTQMAAAAAQLKSELQTMIEQLKDAALENLEEQEDMQKEPIAEKQSEFDAKKTTNEAITSIDEERVKAAEQKLPDQVKNATAHYGLQG